MLVCKIESSVHLLGGFSCQLELIAKDYHFHVASLIRIINYIWYVYLQHLQHDYFRKKILETFERAVGKETFRNPPL